MRELELSMSPIGQQPSMMDVTDVSADDQELSLYGPEPVKKQPKMSTQKLPHLLKRESFRGHRKSDMKVHVTIQLMSHSAMNNTKNDSCEESLAIILSLSRALLHREKHII